MDTTLLTAVVEERQQDSLPGMTVVKISGEPSAAAVVSAVAGNYSRISGHPKPTEEQLIGMIGERVTLIVLAENMLGAEAIVAREGRLFAGTRGPVAIMPKGARKKGYVVDSSKVLDVLPGYTPGTAQLRVDKVRDRFPRLRPFTQERLEELPQESSVCSMALFGRSPMWDAPDCIWLLGEYWPEDDICDCNVLLIRPEFAVSESGSCYGRELLANRALGEVVDFEPIPFGEAIMMCEIPYEDALARVMGMAVLR
jgi:hypothetical protein